MAEESTEKLSGSSSKVDLAVAEKSPAATGVVDVKSTSGEQKLSSKCDVISELRRTHGSPSALAQVLRTGQFDVADVKLLRTCSEPDLTQFSRSAAKPGTSSSDNIRDCRSTSDTPPAEEDDIIEQVHFYSN